MNIIISTYMVVLYYEKSIRQRGNFNLRRYLGDDRRKKYKVGLGVHNLQKITHNILFH